MRKFPQSTALKEIIASAEGHQFPGIMHESFLQQSLGALKERIGTMEIIPCGKLHETADGRNRPTYTKCPGQKNNGVCGHPLVVVSHIRTALWICMAHGILPMKVEPYDTITSGQETYTVLDTAAKKLDAELTDLDESAARTYQHAAMSHLNNLVAQRSATDGIMLQIKKRELEIGTYSFLPLKGATLQHLGMLILN